MCGGNTHIRTFDGLLPQKEESIMFQNYASD